MTFGPESWRLLRLIGPAGAAAMCMVLSFSNPAMAQDEASDDSADEQEVEEIVVTGSRIRRADNLSSPVPMVTMGEEQIELTGSINVYDIMSELPQAGESTYTRGNTNFTVGSSGIQTIDLRGLGESRTLTLVNGRRWVGGVPGTSIVDLNSIPADLIERLEVVTGGASSVYGSDAVAGVVNIILKEDYEGMDIEVMRGAYFEGDGETTSLSFTMGGNFDGGRGNAILSARYDEQGDVMARDRAPYTGIDTLYYGYYYGQAFDEIVAPAYSSYVPQGRYFVSGSTANSAGMLTFDCSARDEDSVLPSSTIVSWSAAGGGDACGFNRTWHRRLEVPLDRHSVFSKIKYDLTEDHTVFLESSYTSVDSVSELEPVPFISEDIFGGDGSRGYHYTNPFVPAEIANAAIAAHLIDDDEDPTTPDVIDPTWNGEIPFIRRLQELGNRGASNTRETFRAAIGMEGKLFGLNYDWYYQYGKSERKQLSGAYNALNFRAALDAEEDALGNIVCADPIARGQGCVPVNVFGMGAITPEAARWLTYESMRITENTQEVLAGNLAGDFEMFGKTISYAFGAETRREFSDDNPDDLEEFGLNGSNRIPRTTGQYDVTGFYVEFLVPLLSDLPMIQDLSFETAYRSDDYSTAGRVDAKKYGFNWAVNDALRFRAVVADSVRAPDISDLFAGQSQTYVPISDPCNGVGTDAEDDMNANVVANCLSLADVAATAAQGTFDPDLGAFVPGFIYSQPDIQTISGFQGGNPELTEETADTKTIGLIWTPKFAEGLAVTVDYYDIEIKNVISSISAGRLITDCFNQNPSEFDINAFPCTAHQRFPATGKLRYWYSFGINQSAYETKGYDVAANYRMEDLWLVPGSLSMKFLYTQRDSHRYQSNYSSNWTDFVGETGINDDKVKLTMLWEMGDWLVSLDNTYYSDSVDDVLYNIPGDEGDYYLGHLPSVNYIDLQVRYFYGDDWQFYLGIDNLNDEQPPYCPNCNHEPSPGSHYTGSQHRLWDSRYWYGGFKYSFGRD